MKDFKEYIKFPLSLHHGKVFTSNNSMAFDFAFRFLYPDGMIISEEQQAIIVDILNGNTIKKIQTSGLTLKNDGIIYFDDKVFIIIRGWGNLTGIGGFHLSSDEAAKIQDEFAKYIINTLQEFTNL
jgi:hypothetical protein